jgi:hypothetical protein
VTRKVLRESSAIIAALPGPPDKTSGIAVRIALALSLAVVVAAFLVHPPGSSSAATDSSPSGAKCKVGEPTSWRTRRFGFAGEPKSVKFYSPVLVLACGRSGFLHAGPLEIVGYDTSEGLCTSAQVPRSMIFGGICFPSGTSWQEFTSAPLKWYGAGWGEGRGQPTQTNLAGYIDTDVAKVEVRFRRQGRILTRAATVAQVDGGLLSKLGVSEPFGRFAALLPGCVPPPAINVVARGADGEFLGAQRGGRWEGPDFCNPAAAAKAGGS